ncbi:MAG: winged helix-turn-helix domain-containing protein [Pseudomonadota bacterium]
MQQATNPQNATILTSDDANAESFNGRYHFGAAILEPSSRTLIVRRTPQQLPADEAQLLEILLLAAPDPVTKETIKARCWPGQEKSDNFVEQKISALRQALRESRDLLQTVRFEGYRIDTEVHRSEDRRRTAWLVAAGALVSILLGAASIPMLYPTPAAVHIDAEQFQGERCSATAELDLQSGKHRIAREIHYYGRSDTQCWITALEAVEHHDATLKAYLAKLYLRRAFADWSINHEDIQIAVELASQAAREAPAEPMVLLTLGNIALDEGNDLDRAIAYYVDAIDADPELAISYESLAHALALRGEVDTALGVIRTAYELDPNSPLVNRQFGRYLLYTGDAEAAIKRLMRSLALDPHDPSAPGLLWIAHNRQGRPHLASEWLLLHVDRSYRPYVRAGINWFGERLLLTVHLSLKRQADGAFCTRKPDIAAQFGAFLDDEHLVQTCLGQAWANV